LRQCLWSLAASATGAGIGDLRIVVVDNASPTPYDTDRLANDTPVRLVRFDTPRSFAAACNHGAALAEDGDDLLVLNNDVFLHPAAIRDALAARDQTGADICGARLVYPDDTIQHCGVLFDGGNRGPYHWQHRRPTDLVARRHRRFQSVTGAFHLMTAALFRRLDGFDEAYPFAYEDVDLCLRAGQMGCIVACAQGVDSIHLQGSSRDARATALERLSREIFFARWRGRFSVDGSEDDR
jgi:GT2 family glycosyltransferase